MVQPITKKVQVGRRRKTRNKRLAKDYLDLVNKPVHNCWVVKQLDTVDNFETLTAFVVIELAINGPAFSCLLESLDKYDKMARLYTMKYAMPRVCD